ncbi:glycosyltransferase [Akkermansiaceae bacterium]|nr:glycosyltransferase [Akkermansiaceae bacterium]
MSDEKLIVGSFPYCPGFNPYQRLITDSITAAGAKVEKIAPSKWFPLHKALSVQTDILHLDWPQDWYTGKNWLSQSLKTWMYLKGLKKIGSKPVVWTAHNLFSHDSRDPVREKKLVQALINECNGIMIMSDSAGKQLRDTYKVSNQTSVKKIFHGHYIDCYQNEVTLEEARKRFAIPLDKFVYLIVGSIRPYKGHREVIKAFAKSASEEDILLIAGQASGEFLRETKELILSVQGHCKGEIQFIPGFVRDNDLQYYYNTADVTVLPFVEVLNSGSLLLAMSFGSPVIAPMLGSIPEIAFNDFYFPYKDRSIQEGGIEKALLNSKLELSRFSDRGKLRKTIIEWTRKKYDWSAEGKKLFAWYKMLIAR